MALKRFEAESKLIRLRRNVLTCIFWTSDSTEKNISYPPGMMSVIQYHPMFLNWC